MKIDILWKSDHGADLNVIKTTDYSRYNRQSNGKLIGINTIIYYKIDIVKIEYNPDFDECLLYTLADTGLKVKHEVLLWNNVYVRLTNGKEFFNLGKYGDKGVLEQFVKYVNEHINDPDEPDDEFIDLENIVM